MLPSLEVCLSNHDWSFNNILPNSKFMSVIYLPSLVWLKARIMGHPVRIKPTNNVLLT